MADDNPNPNPNPSPAPAPPAGDVGALFANGRPEWLPEKHWVEGKPGESLQKLGGAYKSLETAYGKGKESFRAEYEAERLKNRPERPDGYKFEAPKEGLPDDLVLLDKQPGEDFQADPNKRYLVLDPNNPMIGMWRGLVHEMGGDQAMFDKGVAAYLAQQAGGVLSQSKLNELRNAEFAKLGEHGAKRADHVWKSAHAVLGENRAEALNGLIDSAEGIEALEFLLEKAGGAKFANSDVPGAGGLKPLADLKEMQKDPRYLKDAAFTKQVQDGYDALNRAGMLKPKPTR